MANNTLQEFLISLGFSVDSDGAKKFNGILDSSKKGALALGAAVETAAFAVEAAAIKIASQFDKLYWSSLKIKDSAQNINAYTYAVSQLGGTVEGATASLANFGKLLNTNPAVEGFLQTLGVQTRDVNHQLRGTTDLYLDLADKLKNKPTYQANAILQQFGMDYDTFLASTRGLREYRDQAIAVFKKIGVDTDATAVKAKNFMQQMRGIGLELGAVKTKLESGLLDRLAPVLERIGNFIDKNIKEIADDLNKVLSVILTLGGFLTNVLFSALKDAWDILAQIDKATDGWSTRILAAIVAWRLLNASFLASPLGIIISLGLALATLWDDYQTWKAGGHSLIDWTEWDTNIQNAITGIKQLGTWINQAVQWIGGWKVVFELLLTYIVGTWVGGMVGSLASVATGVTSLTEVIGTMSAAAKGGLIALAAIAGYKIGSLVYDKLLGGTAAGDYIGEHLAATMAMFGNKEAKDALRRKFGKEAYPEDPATPGAPAAGAASGAPAAVAASTVAARTQQAIKFFISKGWTAQQASGITANLLGEDDTLDPDKTNKKSGAYGLAQWLSKDRLDAFKALNGKDIHGSSFFEQLAFINHELYHGEKKAGDALRGKFGADDSARSFNDSYERNNNSIWKTIGRENVANDLFQKYRLGGDAPAGNSTIATQNNTFNIQGNDSKAIATATASEAGRTWADFNRNTRSASR